MPPKKVASIAGDDSRLAPAPTLIPPPEIVPLLTMPPENVESAALDETPMALAPTKMPLPVVEILPVFVIPPEKAESVTDDLEAALAPTKMPLPPAETLPLLTMPPETVALLVTKMPLPAVGATILPALNIVPPIELLLMVMPVLIGGDRGGPAVMVPAPALETLLVTVDVWMLMQLMADELLTEPTDTPTSLIEHVVANAAGAPLPISSAATELDANSRRSLPRSLSRFSPAYPTTRATVASTQLGCEDALRRGKRQSGIRRG